MGFQRIVLVGFLGAGKTTAAAYLKDFHDFTAVSSRDPLKELLGDPHASREDLIRIGREVHDDRRNFPYGVAGLTLDYIARQVTGPQIVVDCMRYPPDVEFFQDHRWTVLGIECHLDARIQRALGRDDPVDGLTGNREQDISYLKLKMEEERHPFRVDTSLQMADYLVPNDRSLSEFHEMLAAIVQLNRGIEYFLKTD